MPDLHKVARMLIGFGFNMSVVQPVELRTAFHELAQELLQI